MLLAGLILVGQIAVDAEAAEIMPDQTIPDQTGTIEQVRDSSSAKNQDEAVSDPEPQGQETADPAQTDSATEDPSGETAPDTSAAEPELPGVDSADSEISAVGNPEEKTPATEPEGETNRIASGAVDMKSAVSYSYSLKYTAPAKDEVGGVPFDDILAETIEYICSQEGNYDSVNPNDNGALSIGCIQWNGDRALRLMRIIVNKNPSNAKKILGTKLYNEITNEKTSWSKRTLNSSEKALFVKLLKTQESKNAQNELRKSDLTGYLNHGIKLGISSAPALIYFADIENQSGAGRSESCMKFAKKITGNANTVTLNELHLATICETFSLVGNSAWFSNKSNRNLYLKRRRKTYGYAANLGWAYCQSGDSIIPYGTPSAAPYTGTKWLQKALNQVQNAGLSITGIYDEATAQAVRNYQSAHGLTVDGDAGIDTTCDLILTMYYQTVTGSSKVPHVSDMDNMDESPNVPAKITVSRTSYALNDNAGAFSIDANSNYSDAKLTYKTSNKATATVNSAGKVTVKKAGSATITVSQKATGSHKAVSKKIKITVYSTSPSDYKVPTTTLGSGRKMAKKSVQWLQAALTKLGYSREVIDGKWDKTTLKNVKSFQRAAKLSVDGSVGPATRSAIKNLIQVKTKKLKATAKGGSKKITVSWSKVPGASKYYVYRRKKGGSWSRIKTVSSAAKRLNYTDKSAKKGTKYYYCVRAYRKTGSIAVKSSYKSSALVKRKK